MRPPVAHVIPGCLLLASSMAWGQGRVWVLPVTRVDNEAIMTEETTGGYISAAYPYPKNGHYWWANTNDGVARGWWRFRWDPNGAKGGGPTFDPGFTTEDPPAEPRLYFVRTWIPPAHSSVFSIIDVDTLGPDVPDDPTTRDARTPWTGQFSTNRQWLTRNASNQGNWRQAGPGPQAPVAQQDPVTGVYYAPCDAGGTGFTVWLRKGDWLYVKWNFDTGVKSIGFSAIWIEEANTIPPGGFNPVASCTLPACGGAIDLRCIGNADPLFGIGASLWWDSTDREPLAQPRSDSREYGVDDWSLAAEGYRHPCRTIETPLAGGLPPDGAYTAHLETGDVPFRLRYDGRNSIKWDSGHTNPTDPFYKDRVFTLNNTMVNEFIPRLYNKLYLLTMKNGGSNGQLNVQLHYDDSTSQTVSVPLFDWFNTDGDGVTGIAVGLNGDRKASGAVGLKRIKGNDDAPAYGAMETSGGGTDGAFFFVHPIDIDPARALTQVQLSVSSANPISVTGANWLDGPRRIVAPGAFATYVFNGGEQFTITAGNGGARLQRFGIKARIDDSTIELYDDINDNCGQQPLTGCDILDGSIAGTTGMGGNTVVFAATLVSPYSRFDVAGGGSFGDVGDGILDMNDVGFFQRCYSGGLAGLDPAGCVCVDHDGNGTIGDPDLQSLMGCIPPGGRPGPADVNCDQ